MSYPTRIHFMLKDGTIIPDKNLFTFSYGMDLSNRSVWIASLLQAIHEPALRRHFPWFDDFVLIQTEPYFHVFSRNDLGLGNVRFTRPLSSTTKTSLD